MPLSWSVLKVCSSRPSEPKASQAHSIPSKLWVIQIELDNRRVSASLKAEMNWCQLFGADALGQHVERQRRTSAPPVAGRLDITLPTIDGLADLAQADALQRKPDRARRRRRSSDALRHR